MEHRTIPLQRSLAMSVGMHVLIFGTALAFAHYGDVLFSGPRVITVDLVGEGGQRGGRPGPATSRTRPSRVPEAPAMPDTGPAAEQPPAPIAAGETAGNNREGGGAGPSMGAASDAAAGDGSGGPAGPAGPLSAEQWRLLRSAIEKAKSYPRLARERGIEGVVLVRFRVLPSGAVDKVDIVKSSGAAILDEASVKTVHNAGPMPYVDGWIEVPMVYQLQ